MRVCNSHVIDIYIRMDRGNMGQSSLRGHSQYSAIPCVYNVYSGELLIKLEYS